MPPLVHTSRDTVIALSVGFSVFGICLLYFIVW